MSVLNTAKLIWVSSRPRQWTKNLFVLAVLLFSKNLFNYSLAWRVFLGFFLFSLLTSSVYILNDIVDIKEDRRHPQKKNRPLPSGKLKVSTAFIFTLFTLALSFGLSFYLDTIFGLLLLGYLILNLVYTKCLKHVVILDVFCIAAGFLLRVIAGAVLIDVEVSTWLLICTLVLALFLGFSKRRHELVILGTESVNHKRVLAEYNVHFLDMMIGTLTASTVMSYALYTISDETIRKFNTEKLILTIPFVLYGIFRYLYLVYHKAEGGNPIQNILLDIPLIISVGLWVVISGLILYLGGGR